MGFFSSLSRFFRSMFGIAEGNIERTTDKIISGSPENIKAQFRKTKEDWTRDYSTMREAVAELIRIREMKMDEVKKLNKESDEVEVKMAGAIELFKKTPDERFRSAYGQLAAKNEGIELRIKELMVEIDEQQKTLERYKLRLLELQRQIEDLSKEEAETVADIVSGQKIRELNDRLSGLSMDSQSKNLEAIRSARQKAKAVAKLSTELSGADKSDFDMELKKAGAGSKHVDSFDAAVGIKKVTAVEETPEILPAPSPAGNALKALDPVDAELAKLLSK